MEIRMLSLGDLINLYHLCSVYTNGVDYDPISTRMYAKARELAYAGLANDEAAAAASLIAFFQGNK